MQKDNLFREKREKIDDFHFGQETARVFDDMLDRSVPFYGEIQRLMAELSADFAVEGSRLYDLGCSTGNTLLCLDQVLPRTCISSGWMLRRKCSNRRVPN